MAPRTLGPGEGTLSVFTGRAGAAAKAGHDLRLEVMRWQATLDGDALELTADSTSLEVREGTGGVKPLSDGDRRKIAKQIDDEVLKRTEIAFRSTGPGSGELTMNGTTRPVSFTLDDGGGKVRASGVVKQTDFDIRPYSGLFGALKVADEVRVEYESR